MKNSITRALRIISYMALPIGAFLFIQSSVSVWILTLMTAGAGVAPSGVLPYLGAGAREILFLFILPLLVIIFLRPPKKPVSAKGSAISSPSPKAQEVRSPLSRILFLATVLIALGIVGWVSLWFTILKAGGVAF